MSFDPLTLPLDGVNLIEASAGTGKTWTIAALYARLVLEQKLAPDAILVVTYTRAATAELRGRIRARLAEIAHALADPDPTLSAHDDFCRDLVRGYPEAERPALALRLKAAVSGFDLAAVYTIHGFCQRALSEQALAAGLELGRAFIADETELLQAAVDAAWRRETDTADDDWAAFLVAADQSPDRWQQELRPHLSKPYLRIEAPSAPDTAATTAELARRRAALLARWDSEAPDLGRLLHAHPKLNKKQYSPPQIDQALQGWADWLRHGGIPDTAGLKLLAKLTPANLDKYTNKGGEPPRHPLLDGCAELLELASGLEAAYQDRLAARKAALLREVEAELARLKHEHSAMGFNDLLVELARALDSPAGPGLAEAIRLRYRAALIDEFQDTDPLQFRIFDRLFGPEAGDDRPLFLVGDPKQAIYMFRGADLNAYLTARRQATRQYTLAVNRRSRPPLVQAIEALFSRASSPFLLEELDYPSVAALDDKPPLTEDGEERPALSWQWLGDAALNKENAREQAVTVCADTIVALLERARAGRVKLGERPLNEGDIAVLADKHDRLLAVQRALAERGVASVRVSRQSVFDSEEAIELLQVLAAIAEPGDASARAALATLLMGGDAAQLDLLCHDENAWERQIGRFRRWYQLWLNRGPLTALTAWLHEAGVPTRLLQLRDGERRLTNLLHLFELIEVEHRARPGFTPLIAWFRAELTLSGSESDSEGNARLMRLESDAARVRLVTVHAAKGLEYPVVFCPFLWDSSQSRKTAAALCHEDGEAVLDFGSSRLAERRDAAEREILAEKLRLLYVALTRPKSACFLTWGEVNGIEDTALAWLLAGGEQRARDRKEKEDGSRRKAELTALVAASNGTMALEAPPPPGRLSRREVDATARPQLRHIRRRLSWRWKMASFSSLTAGRHDERPDHDIAVTLHEIPREPDRPFSVEEFPAGARAGVALHTLFERCDFAAGHAELVELAHEVLPANGFSPDWARAAAVLVERTLKAPLTPDGARLCDLTPRQRLVELEFTYCLAPLAWSRLADLLSSHGLPASFVTAARALDAEVGGGFLKGYIDLTCELDGRYYILDYKSNRLGFGAADYEPSRLEAVMASEHYYLQALLYCVALHRFLRWRRPGYEFERHFGGAIYLFLRGIDPAQPGRGVWSYRPDAALLEGLQTLFCGDGA
ncbi:exodeoxyribonuclease V subunit beta [Chitinimonas lacunae]|uniref:RecBCD enzyme subunit RecB n=1 Tax=Chitinimonas lacunae TaxID=1963018 RepID=A0ABV8MRE5_9NEIS